MFVDIKLLVAIRKIMHVPIITVMIVQGILLCFLYEEHLDRPYKYKSLMRIKIL